MRKRDVLTSVGNMLGFIMIGMAIFSNSGSTGLAGFLDIASIFIVIGGLVASLLTVLANLVFIPMTSKLEIKTEEEIFIKQIIIEGVIGDKSGQNPRILEGKLGAFLAK